MLRVLTFHRIAGTPSSSLHPGLISATPGVFEELAGCLATSYRVVSMAEVLDCARSGRALPRRAVLLTFDDAYRDFADEAWPILKRYGLPATLFVPTAFADVSPPEFWWDRLHRAFAHARVTRLEDTPLGPLACATPDQQRRSLRRIRTFVKSIEHDRAMAVIDGLCRQLECPPQADRATLAWHELRELAADGVTLAPHSRAHPLLTRVAPARAREEIASARDDLAREIKRPCLTAFAFPGGAHDDAVVEMLREEGFELGFTTRGGHNVVPFRTPLRLRRTNVTPRTSRLLLRARLTPLAGRIEGWRTIGSPPGGAVAPAGVRQVQGAPPVAYIVSRFPKLSETFVMNEILAVERLGQPVELFPLLRERQPVTHPEAEALVRRARFEPLVSLPIVRANVGAFWRAPGTYVGVWRDVLRETWGSANFFLGALGILPKAVWMAAEARRLGVQHVHAHFANHPAVAAYVVGRLTGIPYSFTAHGSDLHVDRRMLAAKVEAAAFVVAISRFNRDLILGACEGRHAEKVHVVHCGVDLASFEARERVLSAAGPLQIVCVASFEPVKGHVHLVDACDRLRRRGLDFVCHLVGDGRKRGQIGRRIAEHGLERHVVVHGPCTRSQVARLLQRCDVSVLASAPTPSGKREGIPVALMEAMAAGLPVVSTTTGGIPELVRTEHNGLLVPPADAGALADALERLGRDRSLRLRLGRAGRKTIARAFDERATSAAMVALFQGRDGDAGTSRYSTWSGTADLRGVAVATGSGRHVV